MPGTLWRQTCHRNPSWGRCLTGTDSPWCITQGLSVPVGNIAPGVVFTSVAPTLSTHVHLQSRVVVGNPGIFKTRSPSRVCGPQQGLSRQSAPPQVDGEVVVRHGRLGLQQALRGDLPDLAVGNIREVALRTTATQQQKRSVPLPTRSAPGHARRAAVALHMAGPSS